jgi:hypothetical protein
MPKYKVNIEELGYESIIEAEDEDEAELEAIIDCKMNLNKMIDDWNKYLDKLKQEEEQSLAMIYDYDIEPLPNDLVDMINEKNKREK